jgi:TetR/AcrR family transcriptional regulator
MPVKDSHTEEHILNTAKRVFFAEGRLHASPQEIAEAAGVTRTLLNYYFRSKEALFSLVIKQAHANMKKRSAPIFNSTLPFREKIEHFIDVFMEELLAYPYLDTFLITQLNQQQEVYLEMVKEGKAQEEGLKALLDEIASAMEKGVIRKMSPIHFFLSLLSLLGYPVAMRQLIQRSMNMDDKVYEKILAERKQVVLDLLFNQ